MSESDTDGGEWVGDGHFVTLVEATHIVVCHTY